HHQRRKNLSILLACRLSRVGCCGARRSCEEKRSFKAGGKAWGNGEMSLTRTNTAKIYSLLKRRGSLTRREIAERLNLECGEVAARVKELIDSGRLVRK